MFSRKPQRYNNDPQISAQHLLIRERIVWHVNTQHTPNDILQLPYNIKKPAGKEQFKWN